MKIELKNTTLNKFEDYINFINKTDSNKQLTVEQILNKSKELHEHLRNYGGLKSADRAVFVAAILLALNITGFKKSYLEYDKDELPEEVLSAIKNQLEREIDLPKDKVNLILSSYKFILHDKTLNTERLIETELQTPLRFFIKFLHREVLDGVNDASIDILGLFYSEFFSRTTADGNELGIVLTPKHITEFMVDLVKIKSTDSVLDICTGSGGFLIAAMNKMLELSTTIEEEEIIRKNGLIGVELDTSMYSLAFANMKFRGDGKSNLLLENALSSETFEKVKGRASVGLINPPYAMAKKKNDSSLHEWNFALQTLNALRQGGRFACIIPVSCFTANNNMIKALKQQLLNKHTLEAVISMPDQLFYPTSTVTAIAVFTAHVPHDSDYETWFCSMKDDGHVITRTGGRKDNGKWENIKNEVLLAFKNKKTIDGMTASQVVGVDSEWIAEAYLQPDYNNLQMEDFVLNFKRLLAYQYMSNNIKSLPEIINQNKIFINNWKEYKLVDLFDIKRGGNVSAADAKDNPGNIPYIGASESNNGVTCMTSLYVKDIAPLISIANNGSVGEVFFQSQDCILSSDCSSLKLKSAVMTPEIGIFLCTILRLQKPFFDYGRKLTLERMNKLSIKLPTLNNEPDWDWIQKYMDDMKQ